MQGTSRDLALLENKEHMLEDENEIFYLIKTYNPKTNQIREIVLNNWEVRQSSSVTKDLAAKNVLFGHKKYPNLKDMLVRVKLPKLSQNSLNKIC